MNALAFEKSPYLRQHAENPVNWLPWGPAAFEKAKAEDKPIFLSVGYSTCHWCHVMAHESFEDPKVAELLNRDFVSVKLDREERPDVDRMYMLFVQASTGSGGWPMSVWLTPDLKPFFGGTYFPPDSRYGRPGFADLLRHLAGAWKQDRQKIEDSGAGVLDQLRAYTGTSSVSGEADKPLLDLAFNQFRRMYDSRHGGFGAAPKFPRPVVLNFLFRYGSPEAVEMATETLRQMALGGMHDHLGGGFHRYSVDERWFVPHFEKMLYDQAQLASSYVEAFQITNDPALASAAEDIYAYVLRDLTDPQGGLYSAEDADSPDPENPGHSGEGAFYIWKQSEIEQILGTNAALFCFRYGIEPNGNVQNDPHGEFTGRNILYAAIPITECARRFGLTEQQAEETLSSCRETLFAVRAKRPRPHLDAKVLTSWNGLFISALAKGYAVLRNEGLLQAAERAAAFLLRTMYDATSGTLLRRYCDGEAAIHGFLDDYAFLAQALLDLFEVTAKPDYLRIAIDLASRGFGHFEDQQRGGFFSTEATSEVLLRIKDDYDGAEPSGNSVATDVLLRLAHLTGDSGFRERALRSLGSFAPKLKAQPTMAPQMCVAVWRAMTEPSQAVFRCEALSRSVRDLAFDRWRKFEPAAVTMVLDDTTSGELRDLLPFLGSLPRTGSITLYECKNLTCGLPAVLEP